MVNKDKVKYWLTFNEVDSMIRHPYTTGALIKDRFPGKMCIRDRPRPSAKVPKCMLSGKGSGDVQTTRRLAQKQPSFKECVTAH